MYPDKSICQICQTIWSGHLSCSKLAGTLAWTARASRPRHQMLWCGTFWIHLFAFAYGQCGNDERPMARCALPIKISSRGFGFWTLCLYYRIASAGYKFMINPYVFKHRQTAIKADMPAVLRYLSGRRHFQPTGRWVPTSTWNASVNSMALDVGWCHELIWVVWCAGI